jgi:hypothetical protein
MMTSDESWFDLDNPPDAAWAASRDELSEPVKRQTDIGECLISVVWSVNGIHYLLDMPPGMQYNSSFCCDVVLPGLNQTVTSSNRRKTFT